MIRTDAPKKGRDGCRVVAAGVGACLVLCLFACHGRTRAARARLAALRTMAHQAHVAPAALAPVHLGPAEEAEAAALMERALAARDPLLLAFLVRDPVLETSWRLPRLDALRTCPGLPVA